MYPGSVGPLARTIAAVGLAAACLPAHGADAPPGKVDPQVEENAAFLAAGKAAVRGPASLPLAGQAHLQLPEGFSFVPAAEAGRLMRSFGNTESPGLLGLVIPRSTDHSFSCYELVYVASGYVKDDDARDWKESELLDRAIAGTQESNQRRREMGLPEIEVTGWVEKPKYDPTSHQLVWSLGLRGKGTPPGANEGINYRTLVLGREGYVAMTLITDTAHVEQLRPATGTLLGGLQFDDGKRYAQFQSGTDHVAEFGLAALVAGVAAKKLGLIALAAAFVLKFAKVIAVAVVGMAVALRKYLGFRKKRATGELAALSETPPAALGAEQPPAANPAPASNPPP